MRRIDPVELASGGFVLAIGAYFYFGATDYAMGTLNRMGPGFVPHWLGAISAGLGLIIIIGSLGRNGSIPTLSWRAMLTILGAIAAFGWLLPRTGLVVAVLVSCAISILGNPDSTPRMLLVTSSAIALICWTLFILILGLPIPAFWTDV